MDKFSVINGESLNAKVAHDNPQQAALAYCAGLIDGEGCIRIGRAIGTKRHTNPTYAAYISCGMTRREGIDELVKLFGGVIHTERVPGKQLVYRWALSGNIRCRYAVWSLYPFLRVKKRQAAAVLDFMLNFQTHGYRKDHGLPARELLRREDLYGKVRKLNARGAAATTESENAERRSDSLNLRETVRGSAEAQSPLASVASH